MTLENPYRPPAPIPETAHSTFSPDEWVYITKVFGACLVFWAILVAMYTTWQTHFALSQFGAEDYLGRIVALTIPAQHGATIVLLAAINAFVMVTHRRTKRKILEPVQTISWSLVGLLLVVTPMTITLTLGMSLFASVLLFGLAWNQTFSSLQQGLHLFDAARAMLLVLLCGTILVLLAPGVMRRLLRFPGWLFGKIAVTSAAMVIVVGFLQLV